MRFTIVQNKNGHTPPQSSYDFLPPGGTIGRSVDNNLVLPDDDRAISRLQAIVHISADGECRITNRGNVTRVLLNDIPLERGRQVELQDGDILGIDDYRVQVSSSRHAAFQAPVPPPEARVADAPPVVPEPQQPPRQANIQAAPVAPLPPQAQAAEARPKEQEASSTPAEAASSAIPSEIWDSLVDEFTPTSPAAPAFDVSPLSDDNPLLAPEPGALNPSDPLSHLAGGVDLQQLQQKQTDPTSLFGESSLFEQQNILHDTTPSTLLATQNDPATPAAKEDDRALDPLALFGASPSPATPGAMRGDDPLGLMMGGAVPLAQPGDDAAPRVAPPSAPAAEAAPFPGALPDGDPLGLINDGAMPLAGAETHAPLTPPASGAQTVNDPLDLMMGAAVPLVDAAAAKGAAPAPEPSPFSAPPQPESAPPNLRPAPAAPTAPRRRRSGKRLSIDPVAHHSAETAATDVPEGELLEGPLLNALLQGIGLDDLQPQPHFDEQHLRQVGRLLGLFSQGTVALLSSRSILKRGVKAEMTMILDEANNPFKLLPSGQTVLMQMFGNRMPGFMPPEQAVRDALIDLQAHQLGMIAGIRALIAAMLQSINPERLEEEARKDGVTPRLAFPSSRKAALWDYFVKRYQQTAGEIEDDFHTLFGEAFLHAYDVEVNQYKDSQTQPDTP